MVHRGAADAVAATVNRNNKARRGIRFIRVSFRNSCKRSPYYGTKKPKPGPERSASDVEGSPHPGPPAGTRRPSRCSVSCGARREGTPKPGSRFQAPPLHPLAAREVSRPKGGRSLALREREEAGDRRE